MVYSTSVQCEGKEFICGNRSNSLYPGTHWETGKEKKTNDTEKGNIRIVRGREEESLVEGVMVRQSIIGWDG